MNYLKHLLVLLLLSSPTFAEEVPSAQEKSPVLGKDNGTSHYPYFLIEKGTFSSLQNRSIFFWFQKHSPSSFSDLKGFPLEQHL